ncbi:hypothetical protein, partial [Francisella tularensis]|uniref:hypothetical protein n=1 Tax=Francisella tularensis TaxID=263 RepID=UPI002381C832
LCHYLWQQLIIGEDLLHTSFPTVDNNALEKEEFLLVVQINGKLKAKLELDSSLSSNQGEEVVLADEHVKSLIDKKQG